MGIRELISSGKNIYEIPLRVTYYARVSTDYELQSTSIINQVDYFINYIKNVPCWNLVNGYVDLGISGKGVQKREQFLKMITDARIGNFDFILTKSVSRFARNTIDSIRYTDLLLQCGVGVFFLNDNINTIYSDSEFRLTLMASIAQDELRKLSESVRFGLQQSIQRGVVLGNNNILGYIKNKGRLILVPKEAQIVRDIFLWFVTGKYNYKEIGDLLFDKYNKKVDSTGIKRILTNYKYKGYYCGKKSVVVDYKSNKRINIEKDNWIIYRDYDKVPPIIDEEIWDMVQKIISSRCCKTTRKWRVWCLEHDKEFLYKRKKYKNINYGYYSCCGCCSFSEKFLDRLNKVNVYTEILVKKEYDNIVLMVK